MAIFLSYHSSRASTVAHLAKFFHRFGIETWYAPRDIAPGSTWDEAIAKAIGSAQALVLLFCSNADASPHVKREIHLADRSRIPIYWLRVERVEPDKLGYFLNTTQWVDWLDERDATLDTLVNDLRRVVGLPPVAGDDFSSLAILPQEGADWEVVARHATDEPVAHLGAWPRAVHVFPTERLAAECAAHVYFLRAQECPDGSLVLPTGRAATQLFRAMLRIAPIYGPRPFGEAHIITDTETFGVWSGHDASRTRHVRETLLDELAGRGLGPDASQVHLLSGLVTEKDPMREASRVLRSFPPGVHGVSVAPNGEVLAYEVGLYTDAEALVSEGVRVVELSEHGRGYIDPNQPSRSVLTVGMSNLLAAGTLLVLGFDPKKAAILRMMLTGAETPGIPATMLRRHPDAHVLTTRMIAQSFDVEGLRLVEDPLEAAEWIIGHA